VNNNQTNMAEKMTDRPDSPETASPVPRAAGAVKMAQRGAQPRESRSAGQSQPLPETVRCHICHRDEPIARCEDCGTDLGNPHALVRFCDFCKALRRAARTESIHSPTKGYTP
jgi:hypothetical protein